MYFTAKQRTDICDAISGALFALNQRLPRTTSSLPAAISTSKASTIIALSNFALTTSSPYFTTPISNNPTSTTSTLNTPTPTLNLPTPSSSITVMPALVFSSHPADLVGLDGTCRQREIRCFKAAPSTLSARFALLDFSAPYQADCDIYVGVYFAAKQLFAVLDTINPNAICSNFSPPLPYFYSGKTYLWEVSEASTSLYSYCLTLAHLIFE